MNFKSSRRNVIKYAETASVSPSRTVADSGRSRSSSSNRRPMKREQSAVNSEYERSTVADRSSPQPDSEQQRPSTSVEIRVTGPADWAITETSSSHQRDDEAEDSEPPGSRRCQPSPLGRRPRTAWSGDEDVLGRSDEDMESPVMQRNGSMYLNSGFVAAFDNDDAEDCGVGEMLGELQRQIAAAESRLATWKDLRAAAQQDAVQACQVSPMNGRLNPLKCSGIKRKH